MSNDRKRVLIVDDEEDLTWSISKKLSKEKDTLEVLCANSGNSALETLSKYRIDLVVTDLRMPGINGLQLLDRVKSQYPKTNVIVMTAYGSLEIEEALKKWDNTGYIEKPFEINELRKLIWMYLNKNYELA
jgi:DNA-binding NtrC family response regulator